MPRMKDITGSFMCNVNRDESDIHLQAGENTNLYVIIGVAGQPAPEHAVGLYATRNTDYGPFWKEVERLRRVRPY